MVNLAEELLNFTYREIDLPLRELFFEAKSIKALKTRGVMPCERYGGKHHTIFKIACELRYNLSYFTNTYKSIFNEFTFWDRKYSKFSNHCHQCTPALGLMLKALNFEVSYLECFRIENHFRETGIIEKISPEREPNPDMRDEFCRIQRIPYCCLEVIIGKESFYITGKHLELTKEVAVALLTPVCYRDFIGVFDHQEDSKKSGIYLGQVIPQENPEKRDFTKQVVWMKQTKKDPEPELFATYLRMNLTF